MSIGQDCYLVAATALGDLCALREACRRDMTADLLETGNFRNRGDAIRQLHADGYRTLDVLLLVDEAIYAAQQDVIAVAMSDVNHLASDVDATPRDHPGTVAPHHNRQIT